jgi:photosystem II stability/assembly factor-like uncharacterized protein
MKHFDISKIKIDLSRIGRLTVILICLTQIYCSSHDIAILPSIKDFTAVSENEAWLVTQAGKVFHFTEGGQVKTEVKFEAKIERIYFLNINEGWVLDEKGQVWATTDNGREWLKRALMTEENPAGLSSELVFADSQVGWLTGAFTVWMTQDGGASWKMIYPTEQFDYGTLDGQPFHVSLVNSNTAWLGFSNGAILKTTNRGKSWERITTSRRGDVLALYGFSPDECFVSDRSGFFHTADGGKSWREVLDSKLRQNLGIESISFIDKKIGWAAGLNYVTDPNIPTRDIDVLLKTTDAGKTWEKIVTGINEDHGFTKVQFTDERNGWLLGDRTIYRSSDGGSSWVEISKVEDYNRRDKQ